MATASDDISLLFRIRADAAGVKTATAEAKAAVAQLRQSFGPELAQTVSVTNKAFSDVGIGLGNLTQRIPVVGTAVNRLTDLLRGVGVESKTSERAVAGIANSIGSIARESGKSIPQVAQFLTRFTQIAGAAERDSAAVEFFGASLATKLTPQLATARVALAGVTAESAAAGGAITGVAGAAAGLAVPIAAAVIAVGALVAGLALVSRELFTVSKNTAEFQGKMQDLSQQTGVAVETLSTLEVAVATTGGNLNTVTQALVQFQRQMDDAQDPLSKAAANFEELGVAVEDTETTFRNVLTALAAMPEGFKQTNAATELFGSRGGKQVLALLKEVNGDINELQKRLRDAGLLITTDVARAADKFNDELILLDLQLRAAGAAVAKDLIPPLIELIQATSDLVRAGKPLLELIGTIAGPTVRALASSLRGAGIAVQVLTFDFQGLRRSIREAREEAEKGIPAIKVPEVKAPPISTDTTKTAQEIARDAEDASASVKRAAAETNQRLSEAFEQGRINRQQQVDDTIESNRRVLEADKTRIQAEIDAENNKWKQIRDRQDLAESEKQKLLEESAGKVRKLQQDELNAQSLFDVTSRELRARAAQERANSLRAEEDNKTHILTKEFDRQIAAIEARIAQEGIAEKDGLTIIEQLERAKIDERRRGLEAQQRIGFLTVEAQAEISRQIQQLHQEADALEDAQQARRERRAREHSERLRQIKLAEIQTLLQVEQILGEALIESIEAQAALRIRTEENASREILRIRLALIDDELDALKDQQTAAAGIVGVNERTQALAEINARIRVLTAERVGIENQGERDIDAARQRDLQNEREYDNELQDIRERAIDAQRDAAAEVIRLMLASGARRRDIIRAGRDLDIQEEDDRHRRATESIREQQQETDAEIRVLEQRLERLQVGTTEEIEEHDRLIASLERLRAKRAELDAQQEAEDTRTQTRQETITVSANLELANPDAALRDVFDDIGEGVTDLTSKFAGLIGASEEFGAISGQLAQQIGGALAGAFDQFANAIGQTVLNWVLLGETGPAVMRKILAQSLASLAAEAAVNAIKELALGFATLFFNPAESAAHFTAAGLWAAIGGVAAVAGRGIAGDLFKPKTAAAGGGGSGSGSSSRSREASPIDLTRPQQDQTLHIFLHAEPGARFNDAVINGVVDSVRSNGPMRTVIQQVAEG